MGLLLIADQDVKTRDQMTQFFGETEHRVVAADSVDVIIRREGVFYHALKPEAQEDREELLEAVRCAFANVTGQPAVSEEVK